MSGFIVGEDRQQVTLLPECLDDFIAQDNTVRVVDAFISELDLFALGFEGASPASTGRPSYHPAVMLKVYLYGYLNRIQSSRRLERECQRNVELMWLTGRLAPDFKTIADFRMAREESGMMIHRYWSSACPKCPLKTQCTPSDYRRISRWENEEVLEAVQRRLDRSPNSMTIRRRTVEHVFGTLKSWMGYTHFLTRRLPNVSAEMGLNVLAYNFKRILSILGFKGMMKAMRLAGA